jgi:hypothetical protein
VNEWSGYEFNPDSSSAAKLWFIGDHELELGRASGDGDPSR